MEKKKCKFYINSLTLILIILCLLMFLFDISINSVCAINETYSNVLDDLQKDENFNTDDYPFVEKDYTLKVIQVAESLDNELLIYVYHPYGYSREFQATKVNMATEIDDNLSPINSSLYTLSILSFDGVFAKYKVDNFVVEDKEIRTYEIMSILRNWVKDVDDKVTGDNVIVEVPFEVGKLFTLTGFGENVVYSCKNVDVIKITGKYAGYLSISNAVVFPNSRTHEHFVAFSTDKRIDNLMSAKVSYVEIYYKRVGHGIGQPDTDEIIDGPNNREVFISSDDEGHLLTNYDWFPAKHDFKRIVSVEVFKNFENLQSYAEKNLEGMNWVLRFAETLYKPATLGTAGATWYDVSNVSILQLTFETDGVVYTMGVVDNIQTGSKKPVNNPPKSLLEKIVEWLKEYWWVVLLVIIFVPVIIGLIIAFLPQIISFIYNLISKILQGIWGLIKLPFTLFKRKK